MDPLRRASPDTVCGMYHHGASLKVVILFVMKVGFNKMKGWVGSQNDRYPNHGEAISQLMNQMGCYNWRRYRSTLPYRYIADQSCVEITADAWFL